MKKDWKYLGYDVCPVCKKETLVTSTGKLMCHLKPSNGRFYPICEGSGGRYSGQIVRPTKAAAKEPAQ